MDIPVVLGEINEGAYLKLYWGPCSGSSNTYEELSECWPKGNAELPTKEEMLQYWSDNLNEEIQASSINDENHLLDKINKIETNVNKTKDATKIFKNID